ncbi:MAG: carboxypeptidase-like regulatory domain-containing protein [Bryobacteraceae bacterium]
MRWQIRVAVLVLALAGASIEGAAEYQVSGIVVDSRSHTPLQRALVSLAPVGQRGRKLEQWTHRDGLFAFTVSEAGKYSLELSKPDTRRRPTSKRHSRVCRALLSSGADQDTAHVFEAVRGSAISGQILDEDGEPVRNALIAVFKSMVFGGERRVASWGQTRANDAGEFRIANLPEGRYQVCAMGRPWFADSVIQLQTMQEMAQIRGRFKNLQNSADTGADAGDAAESKPSYSPDPSFRGTAFLATFYPDVQSVQEASPVHVGTGDEAQISMTLRLVKAVSVKGTVSVPGESVQGRASLFTKVYDHRVPFLIVQIEKGSNGAFEFENVSPGSYEIAAVADAGSGAPSWRASQELEVGSSNMEIVLRPSQMASVTGRVLVDGERPRSVADLFVLLRGENNRVFRAGVTLDGNFSVSHLYPGRYEVGVGPTEYVAAYLTDSKGERLPTTLEIVSGDTLQRDLTVTQASSTIDGVATMAGAPFVGAFVLLMPQQSSRSWAYGVDQTDSDGSYHLPAIPAGDYFLLALTNGEDVVYRDIKVAEALRKMAKPVHIQPGDHLHVDLDVKRTAEIPPPSF